MSPIVPHRAARPALDAVVIGGSAGAVEGLSVLVPLLGPELPVPIVIVIHLPRRRPSLLPEVLRQAFGREVREPMDKEPLDPSLVYVAPPDYHLLIDEGPSFALSVDEAVNYSTPSIDVLFESAAEVLGPRVAGVLLSGANADGARGLRAIVDAGGHGFVQAPGEAASSAMPEAGIAVCPAARVAPLRAIHSCLRQLAHASTPDGRGPA